MPVAFLTHAECKVVAITEASSGIGAACARSFSNEGAEVTVVGRDPQHTTAVAKEVNAVCPGAVDTPMLFSKHAMPPTREQMQKVQVETVPMQRWATTEEVVQAIMFMASDQAAYITGTFLTVDGGYTCQ